MRAAGAMSANGLERSAEGEREVASSSLLFFFSARINFNAQSVGAEILLEEMSARGSFAK